METGHLIFETETYQLGALDLNAENLVDLIPDGTGLYGLNVGKWGIRNQYLYAQIAFDDYASNLYVWDLVQGQWTYISDHVIHRILYDWPDDRYLAYTVKDTEGEDAGFYLMDTETWQPIQIIQLSNQPEVYSTFPSPDLRYVALHILDYGPQEDKWSLYWVDIQTYEARQIPGTYGYRDARIEWVRWSPSGRYLVAEAQEFESGWHTEIMDVFTGEIVSYPLNVRWKLAFSPDETFFVMEDRKNYDKPDSYLLRLDTQEQHLFENTDFLGWQGGEQDSLLVCPEG